MHRGRARVSSSTCYMRMFAGECQAAYTAEAVRVNTSRRTWISSNHVRSLAEKRASAASPIAVLRSQRGCYVPLPLSIMYPAPPVISAESASSASRKLFALAVVSPNYRCRYSHATSKPHFLYLQLQTVSGLATRGQRHKSSSIYHVPHNLQLVLYDTLNGKR